VPAPGCNAHLIRFFDFGAIYIVCLFILYSSPVILFSSIFPYFSLIYLFLWEWIDSLRFQAGCRKRWLNLALVFLCLFSVVALLPYAFSAMPSVLCLQCYAFSAMPSVLCLQCYAFSAMPSVLWRCFGSRKGIQPVKNWVVGCWRGYLSGWDADLHMAQLMPLPLTVSCFSKIQIVFAFLVPAHLGSPGKMAVKWVCVFLL